MVRQVVRALGLMVALFAFAACSSEVGSEGAVVGGSCLVNAECAVESLCLTGAGFPGGYCAKPCDADDDCPSGSRCVEEMGGFCMVECAGDDECRSDEGYACSERVARGAVGAVSVCAAP